MMTFQKPWLLVLLLCFVVGCQGSDSTTGQDENESAGNLASNKVNRVVEASCGECQFGMPGTGCDLAVRIDGESYFVDGASIDDFGDAHGKGGMCNCIREAEVVGEIKDGRFVATSMNVMPFDEEKHDSDAAEQLKKSRMGVSLAMKDGDLFIHDIWDEGIASKAGLKKDDQIERLNGQLVDELDQEALSALLAEAATIDFTIARDGETIEITVVIPED